MADGADKMAGAEAKTIGTDRMEDSTEEDTEEFTAQKEEKPSSTDLEEAALREEEIAKAEETDTKAWHTSFRKLGREKSKMNSPFTCGEKSAK